MEITKITSLTAVILLIANFVLASMLVYPFSVFWIVLICICAVVYPLNYFIRKKYINEKIIRKKEVR